MAARVSDGAGSDPATGRVFSVFDASVIPERCELVVAAIAQPGSSVLLIGETGAGKTRLAEAAAHAFADRSEEEVAITVLSPPPEPGSGIALVFGFHYPEILDIAADGREENAGLGDPQLLTARLLEAVTARAGDRQALLVLPNVHQYPPTSAFVLEQLVRSRKLRIIATAQRITGAADRITRDPRVQRISVGPLSLVEADLYLSRLLGVGHIAPATLSRWRLATAGNSFALGLLALSSDRSGRLRRSRGLAWEPPGGEGAPEEFAHFAEETCTEQELRCLQLIAQAEPMIETALLRLIDPASANALLERGLVVSRRHPNGAIALVTAHPIVAASVRDRMTPSRRVEVCTQLFDALDEDLMESTLSTTPQQLMRLVVFALESGRQVPTAWLAQAFDFLHGGANPRLVLRLALELARSPDPEEAAVAALRAVGFARLLGDGIGLEAAIALIDGILANPVSMTRLGVPLRTRLSLLRVEHRFWSGADLERVLGELGELEAELAGAESVAREMVKSSRFILLSYDGELGRAASLKVEEEPADELTVEWVRSPARAVNALLLQQQGRLEVAIRDAENARRLSQLGSRSREESIDLHGFCWFLGFWASGSTEAGRQILEELEANASSDIHAVAYLSGLLETGTALFSVQEGRWRDAADQVERLLDQLDRHDAYGVTPLLHALHALVLAALGENEGAARALRRAKRERRGIAQAVAGFRRRIMVRAQQWLRLGDPAAEALQVAEWARRERLALVELEALHIVAFESRAGARSVLPRAKEVAREIDEYVAEVILSHIEKIAAGAHPADVDEPEVRLLADLGLWMPLPAVGGLSSREREIALLASLGYSSRFIAERLHLSVRTVETHLGHVYTKVGVDDREGLRRWFSNDRT